MAGMTEGGNSAHIDLFLRQGLIGGNRVPVLWGGNFNVLRDLHNHADADVGEFGQATDGLVAVQSEEHAKSIPYAARFMKCEESAKHLCGAEPRFCIHCWIERDDGIKPTRPQRDSPRGQVKWHPGWRRHQLLGRNLAFGVLQALQAAVNQWSEGVMGMFTEQKEHHRRFATVYGKLTCVFSHFCWKVGHRWMMIYGI